MSFCRCRSPGAGAPRIVFPKETDDLEAAIDEFGADFSDDEIRLVRIKFISDMAN